MTQKKCFKCGELRAEAEFYKNKGMPSGRINKCKYCCILYTKLHRLKNIEHFQEYDRSRAKRPDRVSSRVALSESPVGKQRKKRYTEKSLARYPYKTEARRKFSNAIRDGKIKKMPCSVCGDEKAHGHHEDYTKPLDVVWFCTKHHAARHRELEEIARILIAEKSWCNGW